MKEPKVRREHGKIYYQTVERAKVLGEQEMVGKPIRVMPIGQRTVSTEEMAESITRATSLTEADVIGVLTALGDEIGDALRCGNRVSLFGIGTLDISLAINRETPSGRQKPQKVVGDDLKAGEVRINKVLFTPSAKLKTTLLGAQFASSGVASSEIDYAKVDEWMTEWFNGHFSLTRKQFENSYHLSERAAHTVLTRLADEGKLKRRGSLHTRFYTPGEGWYTAVQRE